MGLGMQLPAWILIGFFAGYWADGRFGTSPWLLIAGASAGMTFGFISFFTTILKASHEEDGRDKDGKA